MPRVRPCHSIDARDSVGSTAVTTIGGVATYFLRLFGGFSLQGPGGEPVVHLTQRRAEAVLASLAIAGDLGCTRDRLIALLWSESDERHGRHSLRDMLHLLRQALGPDAIIASGEQLTLNPAVVASDVQAFTSAFTVTPLADAVASYRGPLLDGFHVDGAAEFERWVDGERARLFRECQAGIERLADAAERDGRWHEAAEWWARAVELDLYSSPFVVRRISALARAGDRANAIKEGEAHCRLLKSELELDPEPAFLEELQRIRNGGLEPARFFPHRVAFAAPSGPSSPPATAHADESKHRRTARRWWIGAAVAVVAIIGVAIAIRLLRPPMPPTALDARLVSVFPVSAPSGDTALERLAARLGPFIEQELGAGPPLRAAEPAQVRAAWRRFAPADSTTDWLGVEDSIARATGAALHLHVTLERTNGRVRLSARLDRARGAQPRANRHVDVPPDSLEEGARILLLEVQAQHLGHPAHRIAWLARRDPRAVRLFLGGPGLESGAPQYCRGVVPWEGCRGPYEARDCRGWVGRVLAHDSGLVQAVDACLYVPGFWPYLGRPVWRDTLAEWAWRRRTGLPLEDRAFAEALYGPSRGLARDEEARIALWQRAAEVSGNWWMPWTKLATELATYGSMTSIPHWQTRAGEAFARAVSACDTNCSDAVTFAFWFWLLHGDTTQAKALMSAAQFRGMGEPVLTWRVADWPHALEMARAGGGVDSYWADAVERERTANGPLRTVLAAALGLPRGARSADLAAERFQALAEARGLGTRLVDTWLPIYWRTRGYYARWIETRNRTYVFNMGGGVGDDSYDDAMVVQEATYLGAPEDRLLAGAVGRMERIVRGDTAVQAGVAGIARCWLSHWRIARGDTSGVRAAIAFLRELDRRDRAGLQDGAPGGQRWVTCPAVLDALLARATGPDAMGKARALDALLRPMPVPPHGFLDGADTSPTHDQSRWIDNLLAAQLLAAAGDTAAALAAARRRPWDIQVLDLFYALPEYLRAEGLYAAAMADTVGAILAYRHYLGLRSDPPDHAAWRAQWDSVRTHLAVLGGSR